MADGEAIGILKTGHTQVLVPPSAPADYSTPAAVEHTVCGERLALGPAALLVAGKTAEPVPQPRIPGELLFLSSGAKVFWVPVRLKRVDQCAEPIDRCLAVPPSRLITFHYRCNQILVLDTMACGCHDSKRNSLRNSSGDRR